MVFRSQVSIITGGPGKGKTTILKIILQIFERLEKNKSVLLCAPTGRARKRLSESTGYPAFTIHKALYVTDDEMDNMEPEILEEDLIIADELIECFEPKGAFYTFPNIKRFGMTSEEFATRLLQEEKVAVVPGTAFGDCGEGFVRISYAYSLKNLKEALSRIERFINRLDGKA